MTQLYCSHLLRDPLEDLRTWGLASAAYPSARAGAMSLIMILCASVIIFRRQCTETWMPCLACFEKEGNSGGHIIVSRFLYRPLCWAGSTPSDEVLELLISPFRTTFSNIVDLSSYLTRQKRTRGHLTLNRYLRAAAAGMHFRSFPRSA